MTSTAGGQYAVTTLTPGKTHRLRLVNMGINNWVHVGIDGHPFTVIAADFVPIEPFEATSLNIAVGESTRSSFPARMRHVHAYMQWTSTVKFKTH
jgi:FtsP/CotA-like multicopper oxidase with cupredoxin domain